MFAGAVVAGVSAYHLKRSQFVDTMQSSLKIGLWTLVISGIGTAVTGDGLGLAMVQTQPMKMAAAEALYESSAPAAFSLFTLGTPDGKSELFSIKIPYLLSFLSTHTLDGEVEGLNDLQAQYELLWGPGDYMPTIWITYWAFRWMIGLGVLSWIIAVVGLWITRRNNLKLPTWAWNVAIWSAPIPVLASSIGWMFTEMGRQPWIVFSLMKTEDAVSPGVTGLEVLVSLIGFTAVYSVLAVVELKILLAAIKQGPEQQVLQSDPNKLAVAY
jgi:cytochrome d ubiquinol oxidase subunit I